jgi:uncharacterized protein with HEPN domain
MSPEDSDLAFVWDMLDAAQSGVDMVSGRSLEDFTADHTAKLAMERAMEIIGEAARRIGQSSRDAHPEVPWKLIIGQRNIIAHEYGRIDHLQLYRTASEDLPGLIGLLRAMLPPTESTRERGL